MRHIPDSTYRLQFNASFTFDDAAGIIDYLSRLGVGDIYASPIFKAHRGSSHGYDVVDPNRLNPELGGRDGFEHLSDVVKEQGIRWLQDIVPNHMAIDTDNWMLMQVLEIGKNSPYTPLFEIDWNHPYENIRGRFLVPLLGKPYARALEDGEIQVVYDSSGFSITYYDLRLPLKIESYPEILEHRIDRLEQGLGAESSEFIRFLGSIRHLQTIATSSGREPPTDQIRHAKKILWQQYQRNGRIREFIDENLDHFNGERGDPGSFDALDHLLSRQRFRLSYWKVATEEINYRRFFTVNDLLSIRVGDPEVFEMTHRLLFDLLDQDLLDGLRIDHIDGLGDPTVYLERLRGRAAGKYIVVEKILQQDEELPDVWDVEGTTGYDFMNVVNDLLCEHQNQPAFSKIYYKFSKVSKSYDDLLYEKRKIIIEKHMSGNVDNLAQKVKRISSHDRLGKDITLNGLRRALVEALAMFPVYRTYISDGRKSESDERSVRTSIEKAQARNPDLALELGFLERYLLGQDSGEGTDECLRVAMSFQKYSGPIMAKGFEDTLLYVYNRLISLNEVGGSPHRFGTTREEFHRFNRRRAESLPHSMNATSTHDAKRGEDVRARINVLSEIPGEWDYHLKTWNRINRPGKKRIHGARVPDRNDEYFLYQTLLGTYPFDGMSDDYLDRIREYIVKAVREAKEHTAWIKPDTEYEDAFVSFVERILSTDEGNRFFEEFRLFQQKIAHYGMFNSLTQTILKIASPGTPDFYQGSELWDLNLVDPDNRRPVDYGIRMRYLEEIESRGRSNPLVLIDELCARRNDGRIKMFLTMKALRARRERGDLFHRGEYLPLESSGKYARHIVAFARRHDDRWAITVAPRLLTSVVRPGELPTGLRVWEDTRVHLPRSHPTAWKNIITGMSLETDGDEVAAGTVLEHFPVAFLFDEEDQ